MPARTLNDFISEIKKDGLARQNRFTVMITNPPGLLNQSQNLQLTQLFCEQAVLPSLSFSTQPIKTFGEDREVVYDRAFEDITLTFLMDRQLKIKEFFDDWSSIIIDPSTRLIGFYDQYTTTIEIEVQDLDDQSVYQAKVFEVYPKIISQIQLDNNSKDVMKLSVTFAYKYHENRRFGVPGGIPQAMSPFRSTTLSENIIPEDLNLTSYFSGSLSLPNNIPDLYFTNFQQYQQVINDGFSARNAISLLERSGMTSGIGGLFT